VLQWLTFASATIAAVLGGRKAVQGWIYDRRDRLELKRVQRSGWSQTGVATWRVGLAQEPAAAIRPSGDCHYRGSRSQRRAMP
jgi:hypothetical protein